MSQHTPNRLTISLDGKNTSSQNRSISIWIWMRIMMALSVRPGAAGLKKIVWGLAKSVELLKMMWKNIFRLQSKYQPFRPLVVLAVSSSEKWPFWWGQIINKADILFLYDIICFHSEVAKSSENWVLWKLPNYSLTFSLGNSHALQKGTCCKKIG